MPFDKPVSARVTAEVVVPAVVQLMLPSGERSIKYDVASGTADQFTVIVVPLAVAVTVSMISAWSNAALWYLNWLLIFPPWYLVATARRPHPSNGAASTLPTQAS